VTGAKRPNRQPQRAVAQWVLADPPRII